MNTSEAKKVFLQEALNDLQEIVDNAEMQYIYLEHVAKLNSAIRDVGHFYFNSLAIKRIEAEKEACPKE